MNQDFHDHLDVCQQCANHPLNLCLIGQSLLYAFAGTGQPITIEDDFGNAGMLISWEEPSMTESEILALEALGRHSKS